MKIQVLFVNQIKLMNPFKKISVLAFVQTVFSTLIPHFCYHPKLPLSGNCRMCLVQVSQAMKPVASCSFLVTPNLSISLDHLGVKKVQENVLEMVLRNHPLDCPVCDQGGECDLQELNYAYGSPRSRLAQAKLGSNTVRYGKNITTAMERCIKCTKCVRNQYLSGSHSLQVVSRSGRTQIELFKDNVRQIKQSLQDVLICPVGWGPSTPRL